MRKIFSKRIPTIFFVLVVLISILGLALFYGLNYREIHSLYVIHELNEQNRDFEIRPDEKLYIKFSEPVLEEKVRNSFKISPEIPGNIRFYDIFINGYAKGVVFDPTDYFKPDMEYEISLEGVESFYGTSLAPYHKKFKTFTSPKIIETTPNDNQEGIDVNPEFRVKTDKTSDYFDFEYSLFPEVPLDQNKKEANEVVLRPRARLEQGKEYQLIINQIFIPDAKSEVQTRIPHLTEKKKFKTIDPIIVESVFPTDGDDKVSQYSEIKISFNRSVDYRSAEERFVITPEVPGKIGWEEKKLVFVPEKLEKDKEYKVIVKAGILSHDDTGFLEGDYSFSFRTIRFPKEITPKEPIEPQIKEGKYVDIDISQQILTIFKDGKSYGSFQTSTGTYSMPTPIGKFKVMVKKPVAYSGKYDLYMPFWMQFTGMGHGIHELPFWKFKGGWEYKEREAHLGIRVSHGCVRLGVGPAEAVYNFTDIGTPVVVHQ